MKLLFAFVPFFLILGVLNAQNTTSIQIRCKALYEEALTFSEQGNSLKSSQLLNDILRLDSAFYMANFALADLSHETGKAEEEIKYLQKGLVFSRDTYPAGFKFLAQALYKKGEYVDALTRMAHYSNIKKSLNPAEQLLLESCTFSVDAIGHPVPFQPMDPGDSINTNAEEYWPSLNAEANELVFTRLQTIDRNGQKISKPQEDFFRSRLFSIGWCKAVPIGFPVNTDENEGAQSLSADGKCLIFTGCGRSDGVGSCDLYFSMYKNGQWTVPFNMGEPVNSGAWESQPALSADGESLYFVSSRIGGKGKMDIWRAEKTAISKDGIPQFGKVVNVTELNTAGNDLSPFLHADGKTLYFASDGRPGLGGTDLFLSRMENGKFEVPKNLGFPINTNLNEDGLVVEISGERAWFSTNRNPAQGKDIYYFTLSDSLKPNPVSYLKGVILDAKTSRRIGAEIVLNDLNNSKAIRRIASAENEGAFLVCLPSGINYGLSISRKGYLFASENISLLEGFSKSNPKEMVIRLQPISEGSLTTLKNIFFETNSWQLKPESQSQLEEMAQFMKINQGVVMEVVGHTDNVGTKEYNLVLSEKRAAAVVQELLQRQIEPYRIKSRGAGNSSPVGDNNTEEGRRDNRRTDFRVRSVSSE
jgi:outer membrane protein OmpA-like peptidoglycan-associated protein